MLYSRISPIAQYISGLKRIKNNRKNTKARRAQFIKCADGSTRKIVHLNSSRN